MLGSHNQHVRAHVGTGFILTREIVNQTSRTTAMETCKGFLEPSRPGACKHQATVHYAAGRQDSSSQSYKWFL